MKEITKRVCADREEVQGLSPNPQKKSAKETGGKGDVFIYVYIVK